MKVKVKICGIRNLETAQVAIGSGADYIGFNFVSTSKRFIHPEICQTFIDQIKGKIKIVGIFQNEDPDKVNDIIEFLGLDLVQLHGVEDNDYIKKIKRPVIKSVNTYSLNKSFNSHYLLLDRIDQGKGDMVNKQKAKKIAEEFKLFFAGGLNAGNVAEIIKHVKPFAVDVAGGIETKGKEDPKKIKQFIKNAKGVTI
jgi:phosphoribosylanthranilate isomerase